MTRCIVSGLAHFQAGSAAAASQRSHWLFSGTPSSVARPTDRESSLIHLFWPLAKSLGISTFAETLRWEGVVACALPIDQHVGQLTLSMLRMSQRELRSVAVRNKIPWSSCKTEPICDMRRIAAVAEQHST